MKQFQTLMSIFSPKKYFFYYYQFGIIEVYKFFKKIKYKTDGNYYLFGSPGINKTLLTF